MIGGLLRQLLLDQGSNTAAPSPSHYIFVLPELIWPKPPGKVRWKTRVRGINERLVLAQQAKWKPYFHLSMKITIPTYDSSPEDWKEAKTKLKPFADSPPPVDAKSWRLTVEQCTTVIYELKHNKALDVGGWTTESAKAVFLLPRLPRLWVAWLTHMAQTHPGQCQARTWHAHKLVCLKKPTGGHRPISSVWIKLISRLLLKEVGTPLKDLVKATQFGVGVPHGGLALLTKVRLHLPRNPTHVAAQLDFQNAFGTMHHKACIEQLEKHISAQEPWFLVTKNLWSRSVTIPFSQEEDFVETSDGVPQGDPLSTLVLATAVSLLMADIHSEQGSECGNGCICR